MESVLSNEISYRQELAGAQLQAGTVADGQFMLTVNGPAGHTYQIEATTDLINWTIIGTQTMGSSGSFEFTDYDAASYPARFYRTEDTQP